MTNAVVFGQSIYQGSAYASSCSDWSQFQSQLSLPFDDLYFNMLTVRSYSFDFMTVSVQNNASYSCLDPRLVLNITSSITQGYPSQTKCGGHTWNIFQCSGALSFCVDCDTTSCNACPTKGFMALNPCQPCSSKSFGSYYLVGLTYKSQILYPVISGTLVAVAVSRQVIITANVTARGQLYCAAFSESTVVTSTVTVIRNGVVATISAPGLVSVTLSGLVPLTAYDVYCYTQDYKNHFMPLATVLQTKVTVSTQCCRSLSFATLNRRLVESVAVSPSTPTNVAMLDTVPSSMVHVIVKLESYDCPWQVSGVASSAVSVPASFNFSRSSPTTSFSFVVIGSPGCYTISANVSRSSDYSGAQSTVIIRSSATAPNPPLVQSAIFSNDGSKLVISLDSVSDRGQTKIASYLSTFLCAQLLSFPGDKLSTCVWSSNQQIIVTLPSTTNATLALVSVNSDVLLRSGLVKTGTCPFGQETSCTYSTGNNIKVIAPSNPIVPVIQLTTSQTIGACDDIVIDATSTTGNGGRAWRSLVWSVSGTGPAITAANASQIAAYLQATYVTTARLVTIPKERLSFGTYVIGLSVSNFLGESGYQQVSVVVSDALVVPRLSISGSSTINMLRSQALNVFAQASFPSCATSTPSLTYAWSLFAGATVQYNIISFAKDPRFYRLSGYQLSASTSYLLRVSVSTAGSIGSLATTQVVINVGVAGVSAVISGGAVQTFGAGSTVSLDASSSTNLDYSDTVLSYNWACVQLFPNFGDQCRNFVPTTASKYSVASSNITEDVAETQLKFTVFVSTADGLSSSVSVSVNVLKTLIPSVSVVTSNSVVNSADTVILSGSILSTQDVSVNASWTVLDSLPNARTLSAVSLTAPTRLLGRGTSGLDLAIKPLSLASGLTYRFQLSAGYVGSSARSYAQVSVIINSPPVGGDLVVTPQSGTSLNTTFLLFTSHWVDDASDYPFTYVLSYYASTSDKSVVVKNLDLNSYVSTILGQGLQSKGYMVNCVAVVFDTFNGSASASYQVQVNPVQDITTLTKATNSLQVALSSSDSGTVAQVIGAITASVNSVNCTVPVACRLLNRQDCSFTAKTCGPCLNSSYIGLFGDSNVACFRPEQVRVAVQCTLTDASACESKKCTANNICAEVEKSCVNDCSEAGMCKYFDGNNLEVESCPVTSSLCRAQCVCHSAHYGADCSLTSAKLQSVQSVRDALCISIYKTLAIQDVTSDVLVSRTTSISNILLDYSQLTDGGFNNCTAALVETILGHPELCGTSDVANLAMTALSKVLDKGAAIPRDMTQSITAALATLANGLQANMAVGQEPITLTTSNIRMSTSLLSTDEIHDAKFAPPQSLYEQYLNTPKTSFRLDTTNILSLVTSMGVAVTQYTSSPHGTKTASTSSGLQVSSFNDAPSSRRRLLHSLSSVQNDIGVTIVLQNPVAQHYYSTVAYNGSVSCLRTHAPYNVTVACPERNQTVMCSGLSKGVVSYTCPATQHVPQCRIWDGSSYAINPNCKVSSYTATNTTCVCFTSTDAAVGTAGKLSEYTTTTDLILDGFKNTFQRTKDLSQHSFKQNLVIFWILVSLFCISIMGFVSMIRIDISESKLFDKTANLPRVPRLDDLLIMAEPIELSSKHIFRQMWSQMVTHHDWLALISTYQHNGEYRGVKFAACIGIIINFLFVDTILAVLFFYDDGTCETYSTAQQCGTINSLDRVDKLCIWDDYYENCKFNGDIGTSFYSTLMITLIITSVTIPFQLFYLSLVRCARDFCCVYFLRWSRKIKNESINDVVVDLNQSFKGAILRLAKLYKMQEAMDYQTTEEESTLLLEKLRTNNNSENTRERFRSVAYGKSNSKLEIISAVQLTEKIHMSRVEAQTLYDKIVTSSPSDQNIVLTQQFCVHMLSDDHRNIAQKLTVQEKLSSPPLQLRWFNYISILVLPCYLVGTCFYIYLFSVNMGEKSTTLWLRGCVLSFLEYVLVLLPLKIFVKWMMLSGFVGKDLKLLFTTLQSRWKLVMLRSTGLMRDADSLIQHLNPACRVARRFPGLPISRLLMSLNDEDFSEYSRVKNEQCFSSICFVPIIAYASLPKILQECGIELFTTIGVGVFLVGISLSKHFEVIVIAVVLGLVAIAVMSIIWDILSRRKIINQQRIREECDLETGENQCVVGVVDDELHTKTGIRIKDNYTRKIFTRPNRGAVVMKLTSYQLQKKQKHRPMISFAEQKSEVDSQSKEAVTPTPTPISTTRTSFKPYAKRDGKRTRSPSPVKDSGPLTVIVGLSFEKLLSQENTSPSSSQMIVVPTHTHAEVMSNLVKKAEYNEFSNQGDIHHHIDVIAAEHRSSPVEMIRPASPDLNSLRRVGVSPLNNTAQVSSMRSLNTSPVFLSPARADSRAMSSSREKSTHSTNSRSPSFQRSVSSRPSFQKPYNPSRQNSTGGFFSPNPNDLKPRTASFGGPKHTRSPEDGVIRAIDKHYDADKVPIRKISSSNSRRQQGEMLVSASVPKLPSVNPGRGSATVSVRNTEIRSSAVILPKTSPLNKRSNRNISNHVGIVRETIPLVSSGATQPSDNKSSSHILADHWQQKPPTLVDKTTVYSLSLVDMLGFAELINNDDVHSNDNDDKV